MMVEVVGGPDVLVRAEVTGHVRAEVAEGDRRGHAVDRLQPQRARRSSWRNWGAGRSVCRPEVDASAIVRVAAHELPFTKALDGLEVGVGRGDVVEQRKGGRT